MSRAAALIRAVPALSSTGLLRRHRLGEVGWGDLVAALADDPLLLLSLWSDGPEVHALFLDEAGQPLVASTAIERQRYQALSPARPGAVLNERILRDLWGHEAMGARDLRPWLDHGAWGLTAPRAARPGPAIYPPEPIEFAAVAGRERAGGVLRVDGPARSEAPEPPWMAAVSVAGGQVLAVEPRLGFAHRGIDSLLSGRPVGAAVRLAGRIDAGSSVTHALALARAIEDVAGFSEAGSGELASRRDALLELERCAGHLHALGRLAASLGAAALAEDFAEALEGLRATCADGWDHRLLYDTISPGDAAPAMPSLGAHAAAWRTGWAQLARRFDASLSGVLCGLARLAPSEARDHGVLGVAGRASGQAFDARRLGGRQLGAALSCGDALARARLRLDEIGASLDRLDPQAGLRPAGQATLPLKPAFAGIGGEGLGVAEGPDGPVWAWVRLEAGLVASVWFAEPSLPLWSALPGLLAGLPGDRLSPAIASLSAAIAAADR